MLDLKLFRKNPNYVIKKLKNRGFYLDIAKIDFMENYRKNLQIETEKLQHIRNILSKLIGNLKINIEKIQVIKNKVIKFNVQLHKKKSELKKLKEKIYQFIMTIPNLPSDNVPLGLNNKDNQEILKWGVIRNYDFLVKNHVELGKYQRGLDWISAVTVSSSRFVIMHDKIALLHRALGQFMLDVHTKEHGYKETYVPLLVNLDSLHGTGQLPKFSNDLFYVNKMNSRKINDSYALIPTSEVPLINLFKNKIIEKNDLPIKLTALTSCFRSEVDSYGKDVKGLIRMHQFEKVEIIQITHPNRSLQALEQLTYHAEKILKLLELPYRKILLCTGDMGFAAAKTYDLEVWFPSQNRYIEVSSCSNMSDFQARRIRIKYASSYCNQKNWVHTLNGSGLAIGRTLAAVLENYQDINGNIHIPKILQKNYMNGLKLIN